MTYLSDEDFIAIYSKVPRLNVDLYIESQDGVLLALRSIEPCKGMWHFPGGTVYKGETIHDAAIRIAKNETGLELQVGEYIGYNEGTHEKRMGTEMHTVALIFKCKVLSGKIKHDENADDLQYFKIPPLNTIKEHKIFLQ